MRSSRTPMIVALSLALAAIAAGCGHGQGSLRQGQAAGVYAKGGAGGLQVAPARARHHLYLAVLPGSPIGRPGSPLFTPADFTVPPDSDLVVSIRNFDKVTAPVPRAWSTVAGTSDGTVQIAGMAVRSVAPQQVSHTFTVPALHLNVPIPRSSTVTFTFRTPARGSYAWRCEAPCGTAAKGMGALRLAGRMAGTMRVSSS